MAIKRQLNHVVVYLPNTVQRLISSITYYYQNIFFSLNNEECVLPIVVPRLRRKVHITIVITTYFNPFESAIQLQNYQKFWRNLQKQNIALCTVELLSRGQSPMLTNNDATQLIHVQSNSILWQKERLYNIAMSKLSPSYTNIVFLDADVYFPNDNWLELTIDALEFFQIVQPFSEVVRLLPLRDSANVANVSPGFLDGQKIASCASSVQKFGTRCLPYMLVRGSVGIGLAVRREVLDQCLLYDSDVVGGGDHIALFAAYNQSPTFTNLMTDAQRQHLAVWQKKWYSCIQGSVGSIETTVFHYFHGNHLRKQKWNRHLILRNNAFDPNTDIQKNSVGAWEWSTNKVELHRQVEQYFISLHQAGL